MGNPTSRQTLTARRPAITDSSERDDIRKALQRLARAVAAYISGDHEVEHKRGLLGPRTTLVL